ncbi:uncharacterized protein PHACADRAFT_163117 [Phanerochaete carnosa HHB-10118-sp]|uniref:Uncharacterized protein n=1 Tax=Phanerochaete carnosa (strain HHB-10118-sp) TaxID=650164 RepID=K5W6D9_PHACS|nr:uncharacterized protein PHACADRAFT_163117 [Phanerochaete carnosa HHB-10118-sp]EKM54720.1 hypothetical protein PHACADRAFT_163117 [Phanerochaete carnosa HHB-10118-sp]
MHILVPEPNGSAVQTVPLEPIDTGVARMAPGGAASPASAGGVHVNTVGLYRMHIGESGASERMRTDMSEHPRPDAFGDPSAFGGTGAFGDVGNAGRPFGQGGLPSQFGRGAFEFGQQQQLRELQRFQERQHAQQREQQQFYGAGGFDFDAGQPFHPHTSMQAHAPTQTRSQHHLPAHTSPHSHSSPHAYSPMQRTLQGSHAQHPHSPIHTLSPALSDFRAGSEYSHSSSSSSSRGGSVSSGSGSVRMLAGAGGAWSPQSGVDFGGYHIKSEYSELGMAFGQWVPPDASSPRRPHRARRSQCRPQTRH